MLVVEGVLDAKAWIGQQDDWQPKARLSLHAVAVNTNLQPNEGEIALVIRVIRIQSLNLLLWDTTNHAGLQVRFQAMRSTGADRKVVSIRISQQLV